MERREFRVLLVEDNPGDARLIREYVSGGTKEVFLIDHCEDLAGAQTHLARTNADVVLLDLGLPDSQGMDTLRSIRKQAPRLPIVVLTGLRDEEMGVDASREGAQDYLTKDALTPELLTTTLRYAIARQEVQDELQESLERFRLANRATFDAIWDWNLQTDALWWNDNLQTIFGYRAEEVEPGIESWEYRIHPEDLDRVKTGIHAAIDSGQDRWLDHYRFRRRDGMYADVEDRGYIARDASGRPMRMIGAMQDITTRKQAEERIRASEAHLEEAQRTAHLGSWEMDLSTGRVTWSDELCRLFEIPPETIRAGTSQLRAAIDERIHPDDRARYTQAVARTVDQKMPYDIDYRIQLPDGSQRHIHAQGAPSSDPAGNVVCLAGTAIDITERKKAEHALRESEDRYRSLVDNVPGIIFTIDLAGKITFVTRRVKDTLGYESAEVINKSVLDFIPEEERKRAMEAIQKGMTGVGIKRFETPMMKRSGERAWFECSFTRVRRDGAVIGAQGTAVDISERKHGEAERNRLLARQVTLNRVTLALGALTELPAILRTLHDEVRTLLDADGFFVSRYHTGTQLITALFAIDEGGERDVSTFPPIPLAPEGRGMQSQVLRTAKPLKVPDWIEGEHRMQTVHHIAADGTFTPPPPETERDGCTKSALLVPLMFRGEPIGVLQAQSNRLNAYSDEDVDLLAGLGNVAAISIQNALLIAEAARAEETLRLSLEGTLHAVSAAAETRDPYTAGHQRRATDLAIAIARVLGCSDDECNTLRIAGTVHDIGKLGIPAEILSKPGTLAPIELALIREHPQTAYDILADVPFPGPVAEIVLQHHERLDGSGYPRALAGDQILREARILAVADVVEAMASHRPYRAARGIDAALGEIEQNAGRLYDPEAVQACLHLFRDKGYALPA
jgi:PAS domain S-box-containing protein